MPRLSERTPLNCTRPHQAEAPREARHRRKFLLIQFLLSFLNRLSEVRVLPGASRTEHIGLTRRALPRPRPAQACPFR